MASGHGEPTKEAGWVRMVRGRQREAALNDGKVLRAARTVFARDGWDAPVAAVAAEAGVGMGSLYRRYGSKTELLQRLCVLAMDQGIELARRALDEPDPWRGLAGYVSASVAVGSGAFAPMAGTIPVTETMYATARRWDGLLHRLVDRAQTAGALRPDVTAADIALLIRLHSRPVDDDGPDRLLAISLDGLRAAAAHPLPSPPPNPRRHIARWRDAVE